MKLGNRGARASETLIDEVVSKIGDDLIREARQLRAEVRGLRDIQLAQIQNLGKQLIKVWTDSTPRTQEGLHFDDPIWGQANIPATLAALFGHPLVQRLNYIKQLSFAYLTFPSATHTRMSHSLGVCTLVERALTTIFRNDVVYSAEGADRIHLTLAERSGLLLKAQCAALLHDLGHAPFGHALDRLIGFLDTAKPLPYPDKYYSRLYLRRYLRSVLPGTVDIDNLESILSQNIETLAGWDVLISDLIDSALDVDRMDFLARDAHMSGLSFGSQCAEALIERMCPFQAEGGIYLTYDRSCLPYVDDLLSAREQMYLYCYEHPRKLAAERIFTRLVQNLFESSHLGIDEIILLTDEQILALMGLAALGSNECTQLLLALLQGIEYVVAHEVSLKTATGSAAAEWKRTRDRSGMGRHVYVELPSQWEREITIASGIPIEESWRILVVVPDHKTGEPSGLATKILSKEGDVYKTQNLFKLNSRLLDHLKYESEPRRRIRVFADSRMGAAQLSAVTGAARSLFD